jgi:hypothetical protein
MHKLLTFVRDRLYKSEVIQPNDTINNLTSITTNVGLRNNEFVSVSISLLDNNMHINFVFKKIACYSMFVEGLSYDEVYKRVSSVLLSLPLSKDDRLALVESMEV